MTGSNQRGQKRQVKHEEPEEVEVSDREGPVNDTYDLLCRRTDDVEDSLERIKWAAGVLRRQRARNEHNVLEILLGNIAATEERLLSLRREAVQLVDMVKIRYNRDRQFYKDGF
jgi:hypothetical protein